MATFTKRGERWFAQVKRGGVRKSMSFDTKSAAKLWATKLEAELDTGAARGFVPTADSVGQLIDRYCTTLKPVFRWGRSKDDSLAKLKVGLGARRAGSLTAADVIAYAGKRAKGGAGGVTIGAELSYLRGVLKLARHLWRLDVPFGVVSEAREALTVGGMVGKSKRRNRIATAAEIERVRAAWRSVVPFEIVPFALDSCMRLGEIARITWEDFDGDTVWVRDRKDPKAKHGNDMQVPLLGRARPIIEAQPRHKTGRIFPYAECTIGAAWLRACRRAGVVDLRFHDLRHTGITALFAQGLRIEQVAVVSGHRDWASLKRYTHLKPKDVIAALAALKVGGQVPLAAE